MGKWKVGVVGIAVGAAVYHVVNQFINKGPRLVPEVVLDGDVSENKEMFWAVKSCGRGDFELVKLLSSEDPNIIPMGLRLRNVGDSEAQNVKVGDVSVLGEIARWDLEKKVHVILAGQVSDLMQPQFDGPSGLFKNDFPMKAYTQSFYSDQRLDSVIKYWEKNRDRIKEQERGKVMDVFQGEGGFYQKSHFNETNALISYLQSVQSSADYIEDIKYPASATYEDRYGRKYIVEWDYVFHPINHDQVWGKLVMGNQDAHSGEGCGLKPPGPCITISSFRNRMV